MAGESSRTLPAGPLDRPADSRGQRAIAPEIGGPELGVRQIGGGKLGGGEMGVREMGGGAGIVARWCGIGALVAVVGTVLVFAALHLLPPTSRISPVTRTISEYALTSSAWAFNLGVLLLVAASAAVFGGLAALRRVRAVGAVFGGLWVAGLLTLVSFPKHNWALGSVSTSGQVHRLASLVAFLALPIAVIAISRRRGRATYGAAARWAFWLGVVSLAWFSPLLYAVLSAPVTGIRWWQAIPLGLVERGLALTEVSAIAALAVLAVSLAGADHRLPVPFGSAPQR